MMISSGRYLYHLQDIAEIKAMSTPHPIHEFNLRRMEAEAKEFEHSFPDEAKEIKRAAKTENGENLECEVCKRADCICCSEHNVPDSCVEDQEIDRRDQ